LNLQENPTKWKEWRYRGTCDLEQFAVLVWSLRNEEMTVMSDDCMSTKANADGMREKKLDQAKMPQEQ